MFTNLIAKYFFMFPKARYITPKTLNVNFRKSVNQNFKIINLKVDYSELFFTTEYVKIESLKNNSNFFSLKENFANLESCYAVFANFVKHDGIETKTHKIFLSAFETKKNADSAVSSLKNMSFSMKSSLMGGFFYFGFAIVFLSLLLNFFNLVFVKKETTSVSKLSPSIYNMPSIAPNYPQSSIMDINKALANPEATKALTDTNPTDVNAMIEELQKQMPKESYTRSNLAQKPNAVKSEAEVPSDVDSFFGKLKK